ncbi:MAG: DUF2339 domain-containing protein [Candidatus Latescibacteria bacterium]|nr:DUF2339 domain-containing protein [Candidatus Latescibacterota bacterium]
MTPDDPNLLERVERLERVVEGLLERDPRARAALAAGQRTAPPASESPAGPPPAATPSWPPRPVATPSAHRPAGAPSMDLRSVLRVVGIALLLFGVAFLFKYSENESESIHSLRVLIGIALGVGLTIVGHVLLRRDRPFAQILTGGGIATWFMSGFAAYQLFGLIGAVTGFAYMAAVTTAAFAISVRQDSLPLTIVATIGGLATPFLLYDPSRSMWGVSLYVVAVASSAIAIHRRRGWWALLWIAAGGSCYAIFATVTYYSAPTAPQSERVVLQGALLFLFGLFALTSAGGYARGVRAGETGGEYDTRLFLVTLIPVVTVALTDAIWTLNRAQLGQLCFLFAFVYLGATVARFPRDELRRLINAYLLLASGFATVGALALIDGEMQHLAIATEALLLRRLTLQSRRISIASVISHALFGICALLVVRDLMVDHSPEVPVFNRTGVTTLWSIVAAALAALSLPAEQGRVRRFYLYAAHVLILAWILRQFAAVASGQAIVTIIWGVYGATLLIAGLLRTNRPMRTVGFLTLLAVVTKLFAVDLASVRAIWRVLLFIGFGGVFLSLSYWFLTLDRSTRKQ